MTTPSIVSREEWLVARRELLEREKAFTRERDALSASRRALPWVAIEEDYVFEGEDGPRTLSELFAGRRQLIVQHFMFGPDWEAGCPSCSFWADGYDGIVVHLAARDISMVAISRAPLDRLLAYRQRMGWRFTWLSSLGNDFNEDFQVSFPHRGESGGVVYNYREIDSQMEELPGMSVFYRNDDGRVFHTYSCYSRGLDMMNAAYHYMDLAPLGRNETDLPHPMAWVRRHDAYEG